MSREELEGLGLMTAMVVGVFGLWMGLGKLRLGRRSERPVGCLRAVLLLLMILAAPSWIIGLFRALGLGLDQMMESARPVIAWVRTHWVQLLVSILVMTLGGFLTLWLLGLAERRMGPQWARRVGRVRDVLGFFLVPASMLAEYYGKVLGTLLLLLLLPVLYLTFRVGRATKARRLPRVASILGKGPSAQQLLRQGDRMSKSLLVGSTLFVIAGLFPPWVVRLPNGLESGMGYALIFRPPQWQGAIDATIDITRLLVSWVVISVATVGMYAVERARASDQ